MERNYYPNNPNKNNSVNESSVRCKHCGKNIIASNYLLHEARCGLMSSRVQPPHNQSAVQRPQPEIKPPQSSYASSNIFREESRRVDISRNINQGGNNNRQRERLFDRREQPIFQPPMELPRQEQQERIPCHYCGYMQTLAQLDTHPQNCQHRQQECSGCHQKFPRSLMNEHMIVCSAQRRNENQHHHHQHRNFFPEYQMDNEYQQNYNPFGNFRNLFGFMRRSGRDRQQQRHHERMPRQNPGFRGGNGMMIIERNDGQGNFIRQVIPSEQFFGQRGGEGQRRASPFTNFFALLELMAARQAPRNVGLTKDQIKDLKRITYNGANENKVQNEKDLCTICYCEFEKDQKLVELRCKHVYHEECITKWVERNAKCPVCKKPQTDRPIFEEEEEENMMLH